MTKREIALQNAKIAGYHGDARTFTRLIIESRVNRAAMNEAYRVGMSAKANGVGCKCPQCNKGE